ncbi:Mobile element protein [Caenispirillum salinarum AK4]|uniref:Mutator family transposase n=1 Tax=Caenispirillum salinarum AK4 TaxID=1238182 RepID=K9HJX1_9PROT|nr:IS256 family transposase [Caenispirillum salinarum]EKV28906.1 Mobile element protein [Caenispirillum salinarum AK4]
MTDDTVVALRQPGETDDPLTEILRSGARQLLAQAVEAEIAAVLAEHEHLTTVDGRRRLVRHGHGPEREILTGIGPVPVRRPKVRDRGADGEDRIRFTSAILPRFARRTRSIDAVLPTLYLRGLSSGDFQDALEALLGKEATGLSPQVISRLKTEWQADYERWRKRDLTARQYVYIWADGVYLQGRLEDEKQCILVIIGATPEGRKELVGFQAGFRESTQSWRELLNDIKGRGLAQGPKLAVGDGALGFWKALDEVFPGARHQRCWVHKTANVLNKLPKSRQKAAKEDLHAIWMADGRTEAEAAMDTFEAKYGAKYPQAVGCLMKYRHALLAFYDFPAEHWQHVRTSNPIESVFATVRHRTVRTKGCLSHKTALAMVFKLVTEASKTWRRLSGNNRLPQVIKGVRFRDGIQVKDADHSAAA